MSGPAVASTVTTRRIVELACRAPSVHNTQPWAWRVYPETIELYADWARHLTVSDPEGRNLVISCGAALHHAQVVAAALGLASAVSRTPDPTRPQHLATLELTPADPGPDAAAELRALELRSTDRHRFTDWPIPDERLRKVAESVTQDGVRGLALIEMSDRFRVELLVSRALTHQAGDAHLAAEQRLWLDHGPHDGVLTRSVPDSGQVAPNQQSRFASPRYDAGPQVRIGSDGLIVIGTDTDERASWLRAGEALSALWLHATVDNLSVVPLSQVTEVDETRQALQFDVLGGAMVPQLLVRIGWQELGVSQRPRTPRRPVDEVLLP